MTDTKDTNVVHATQAEIDARMAEKIQKAPKREEGTLYSCLDFTDPVIVGNTFTSKMKLGKFHAQPFGWLNGGATLAYAEDLSGWVSYLLLPEGKYAVGQNITAQHLRPTKAEGYLHASGEMVLVGRNSHVFNIKFTNDEGKLISLIAVTGIVVDVNRDEEQK